MGGDPDADDVGLDLANFEAAYQEAHHAAIDMWAEARRAGRNPSYHCFEVRNARAQLVLELPFSDAIGIRLAIQREPNVSANEAMKPRPPELAHE